MDLHEEEGDLDNTEDLNLTSENSWFTDTKWTNIKDTYHEYLLTFPKNLKQDEKLNIELPHPVYSTNLKLNIKDNWIPFLPKLDKNDSRLDYYRKLYSKSKKKLLIKDLETKVLHLPKYLIDVATDSTNENDNEVWYYNGGLLDCVYIDRKLYAVYVSSQSTISCIDIDQNNLVSTTKVDKSLPIYNIKCNLCQNVPMLGVRRLSEISLLKSYINKSRSKFVWKKQCQNSFIDMAFMEFCDEHICTLDNELKVTVEDIEKNETILEYFHNTDYSKRTDHCASISLLDSNILAYVDRCCIYLLDLRSKLAQKKCLKDLWDCDELCTLTKKNSSTLYISSKHNILEFNIEMLKCTNKVMHLMSKPPFVSSVCKLNDETCLSLMGQTDKVLMRTTDQLLSLPQYIPNITDTLNTMCSTVKLDNLDIMNGRLCYPIIGMKLYTNPVTNEVGMLTSNTAGDVFQQRVLKDSFSPSDSVNVLVNWTKSLSSKTKHLEVTNVCNLTRVHDSITSKLPSAKGVEAMIKSGTAEAFAEKNLHIIEKGIKSKVGEVMNALWEEDNVTKLQDDTVTSQSKVIEWLGTNL